jgi:site-specific recombinase XerC
MEQEWGETAARTQAKNISIIKGFFEWAVRRGKLHGDPARPIRPPKERGVERTTFSEDQERAIFAQNNRRDGLALHLLLKLGIRKGALQGVQFRHFNHARRRLTVFTKGAKVQTVPIVDPAFWNELERPHSRLSGPAERIPLAEANRAAEPAQAGGEVRHRVPR